MEFGKPEKTDKLVEQVVRFCKEHHPEALDQIFDSLPVNINEQVLEATIAILSSDINQLSWFCGYFAGEINCSEDNHKLHHPITNLAKILMSAGMQPFIDFTPYPGCRLVIANTAKFESLPQSIKGVVEEVFNLMATPDHQMKQMNDALMQELVVSGE